MTYKFQTDGRPLTSVHAFARNSRPSCTQHVGELAQNGMCRPGRPRQVITFFFGRHPHLHLSLSRPVRRSRVPGPGGWIKGLFQALAGGDLPVLDSVKLRYAALVQLTLLVRLAGPVPLLSVPTRVVVQYCTVHQSPACRHQARYRPLFSYGAARRMGCGALDGTECGPHNNDASV